MLVVAMFVVDPIILAVVFTEFQLLYVSVFAMLVLVAVNFI